MSTPILLWNTHEGEHIEALFGFALSYLGTDSCMFVFFLEVKGVRDDASYADNYHFTIVILWLVIL